MAVLQKLGLSYEVEKSKIESFDLILFDGKSAYAHLIKVMEERGVENVQTVATTSGFYSHVGIALRKDALPHIIQDDDLYIWESTLSGIGESVKNIDGKSVLGVQLRNFSQVIAKYDDSSNTRVAYAKLINRPSEVAVAAFAQLFDSVNGTRYDLNPYDALAAFVPFFRKFRTDVDQLCHTYGWLFCSELVASVYKYMGLLPAHIDERDIVPQDFICDRVNQSKLDVTGPPIVITYYPITMEPVLSPKSRRIFNRAKSPEPKRKQDIVVHVKY